MPGIVGFITGLPRRAAEPQLRRMIAAICHESFYVTGMWIDEAAGVYVGWAHRKNSFADEAMPLRNEREDVCLVFSGEEFPDPGTVRRLKERGHVLQSGGPSYLVHLYEEDPCFLRGLNGRFHGLLTDRTRQTTMLFNDRWGMHRIYYHESKEGFYFAAEAKAILAVCREAGKIDARSLGEFVSCGCVLENRTIFQHIGVLPPASAWIYKDGKVERKTYFEPREWEEQSPLEPNTYYQEIRDVFSRNLPRYFNGRERIGMSLTGGLDSRMIMAWQESAPGALPCYSFSGTYRDSQDVLLARKVARLCAQPHQVIPVGKEFLSRFSHYAERTVYLTDGLCGVGSAPDLYINERVRQIAPVRMTGNYGGEVLRHVRAFKPEAPASGLFDAELGAQINRARITYAEILKGHPLSFAVFRQAPWHHYSLLALEETQVTLRSPYLDSEFVQTVFRAPRTVLEGADVSVRLIADGNPGLMRLPTDRGSVAHRQWLPTAFSRRLHEFGFKAEYAYDYGMPQWVARADHLLSPLHLERLFLGRHKFSHFRVWYRDELSTYVREMLLDPKTLSRAYVERKRLEAMVQGHMKGDQNHTTAIHTVLTLELMHRLFLDAR